MRIGLVGTYDVNNYGDCLFPELWQRALQRHPMSFETRLFSPTDHAATILSADRIESLPATISDASTWHETSGLDAVVLTGGETMGAGHSAGTYIFPLRTMGHYLRLWLGPMIASTMSAGDVPFVIHASGMPPDERWDELIGPCINNSDYVTVRDHNSARRLTTYIASNIRTNIDPVFAVARLFPELQDTVSPAVRAIRTELGANYLMAHISRGQAAGQIGVWCDAVAEMSRSTKLPVALVPICNFLYDAVVLERASLLLRNRGVRCTVAPDLCNVKSTASVIAHADAVTTTSLHAAVTAVSFGTKVAVLASGPHSKHFGTLETVGMGSFVTTEIRGLPDRLKQARSTDSAPMESAAADIALRDLHQSVELIVSGRSEHERNPQFLRYAHRLVALERSAALSDKELLMRRFALRNVRRVPRINQYYEGKRLERVLNSADDRH